MTHIIFDPIKNNLPHVMTIYDPACGSGGMLTESEQFAKKITEHKSKFVLYGQEVNPETYAICTSDMLIKDENPENIAYGSTLGNDGFMGQEFDFMLSNPPYGKSWKIDIDAIQDKDKILDSRFQVGTPRSSDGQLLFLSNMAYKMKKSTELGSRVASVHNGSALFTGDAGSGESNIRKWLIENDWLECIIGLPKNMFYNTGISTYIFILNNRKPERRKGKVQLIDASEIYQKMRKSLGNKSHELTKEHIRQITDMYLAFEESEQSKIFDNSDFGYQKITVERPLRLSCQFTQEKINSLRFLEALKDEMEYIYDRFGEDVYSRLKPHKEVILKYWETNEIKVSPSNKNKLFDSKFWLGQRVIMEAAQRLFDHFGETEFHDFNSYRDEFDKAWKKLDLKLGASEKKQIINAISWKNDEADRVIKKKEKDGSILYEADSELRDNENVPLLEDIDVYFEREVAPHVPDAWIDYNKTTIGYEISFTKYFYKYQPLRSLEEITQDLIVVERESEGLLKKILQ
jgi:type I restriction enzyme M protein